VANEDLRVLSGLLDALGVSLRGVAVPMGAADELLVKREKAPNAVGARALGFGDAGPVLERVRAGEVGALIVLGHDLVTAGLLAEASELGDVDVLLLDTHHSALERAANVVFPTRHAAERSGSFTNHAGLVQRFEAALEPGFDARTEAEVLERIGAALALPGPAS
jgi:NADH-quinone oxidoreductase subunit G